MKGVQNWTLSGISLPLFGEFSALSPSLSLSHYPRPPGALGRPLPRTGAYYMPYESGMEYE